MQPVADRKPPLLGRLAQPHGLTSPIQQGLDRDGKLPYRRKLQPAATVGLSTIPCYTLGR